MPHLISVGALPIRLPYWSLVGLGPIRLFYWSLQQFRPALFRLFQFVSDDRARMQSTLVPRWGRYCIRLVSRQTLALVPSYSPRGGIIAQIHCSHQYSRVMSLRLPIAYMTFNLRFNTKITIQMTTQRNKTRIFRLDFQQHNPKIHTLSELF